MRQNPPDNLVDLLQRLGVATPDEVAAVDRRARRLAHGLPLFTSVWVGALVQVRLLTPFQAAAINAERGESLRVGRYVLSRKLPGLGWADVYEARDLETGMTCRLAVFSVPTDRADQTAADLDRLVAASSSLPREVIAPVEAWGRDGETFWVACDAPSGVTAAQWLIHHGRLPGPAVLEIARAMLPGLVALERAGLCHGDLRAATLLLGGDGAGSGPVLRLPFPGVRTAVRPREGYSHADLAPEVYDGLAPERVRDGAPPSTLADVYACGCLWWHLLTGRDPLPGGDGLTQLQAAEKGVIPDAKPLAPDAPAELLVAIRACLQVLPDRRPRTTRQLVSILGAAVGGPAVLRRVLPGDLIRAPQRQHWGISRRPAVVRRRIVWLSVVAVCLLAGAVATVIPATKGNRTATVRERSATDSAPSRSRLGFEVRERSVTDSAPSRSRLGFAGFGSAGTGSSERPTEFLLGDGGFTVGSPLAQLPLAAGQRVRGSAGKRVILPVSDQGLSIDVPGVVFENVDFVWRHPAGPRGDETPPAMLVLRASSIELRQCTFRSSGSTVDAVRWIHPSESEVDSLSLPSGRITVDRCVFRGVAAAIDGRARGAVALRLSNVLHLGTGPLVRLARPPAPDGPFLLALQRTTLRESGPLVECASAADAGPVGKISVETNGCIFSPRQGQPLLALAGESTPDAVLAQIAWTGQGSLVVPGCPIVGRVDASGTVLPLAETSVAVEGLVRSQVEFAGAAEDTAVASQAVRWLAPLPSDEAPGIDAASLPKEEQETEPRP